MLVVMLHKLFILEKLGQWLTANDKEETKKNGQIVPLHPHAIF